MATQTLTRLLTGDPEIVEYYGAGMHLWSKILDHHDADDTTRLASLLTDRQGQFEERCGGRWLGREIMALTGIGQFFQEEAGFYGSEDAVIRVRDAFQRSFCSIEVKWFADRAADLFGLAQDIPPPPRHVRWPY